MPASIATQVTNVLEGNGKTHDFVHECLCILDVYLDMQGGMSSSDAARRLHSLAAEAEVLRLKEECSRYDEQGMRTCLHHAVNTAAVDFQARIQAHLADKIQSAIAQKRGQVAWLQIRTLISELCHIQPPHFVHLHFLVEFPRPPGHHI